MGPTLACPSAVGEYTAFLREQIVDTMKPATNPMTRVTMKVMITLIVTVATVNSGVAVIVGGAGTYNFTVLAQTCSTDNSI